MFFLKIKKVCISEVINIINYIIFLPLLILIFFSLLVLSIPLKNFDTAIYFGMVCSLFLYFKIVKLINEPLIKIKFLELLGIILFFFVFVSITTASYWMFDINYSLSNSHASYGTIESGRYANIADFIIKYNYIPSIKQNYGQSILAACINKLFGINAIAGLFLLSVFAKVYLGVFLYLIIRIRNTKKFSIFLTMLFFISGLSLTLDQIINIDTGFPFLMTGYFDVIFSLVTLMMFIYLNLYNDNGYFKPFNLIFYMSWFIFAPQNILLCLVFFMILILFFKQVKYVSKQVLFIGITFLFSYAYGGFFIGHSEAFALENIQGLDVLLNKFKLVFNPGFDFLIFYSDSYPGFKFEHISSPKIDFSDKSLFQSIDLIFVRFKFMVIHFFLILFVLILSFFKFDSKKFNSIYYFYISSIILAALVFFIEVDGYKWPMSRFITPVIFFSVLLNILYLAKVVEVGNFLTKLSLIMTTITTYPNFLGLVKRMELFFNYEPLLLLNKLFEFK